MPDHPTPEETKTRIRSMFGTLSRADQQEVLGHLSFQLTQKILGPPDKAVTLGFHTPGLFNDVYCKDGLFEA